MGNETDCTSQVHRARNQLLRLPPSAVQILCDKCKKLDLTAEKFVVQQSNYDRRDDLEPRPFGNRMRDVSRFGIISGSNDYELGTYKELATKRKFCPFCRLVHDSAQKPKRFRLLRTSATKEAVEQLDFENSTCYASWEIDGRVLVQGVDHADVETRERTRRIRIRWEHGAFQDQFLILIPPPAWASSGTFLGRYIGSASNNGTIAKNWVNLCHESHGSICKIERGLSFRHMISRPYFGVVDVDEMRLTALPEDARYVALSYVWRNLRPYKTTLATVQKHRQPRGLESVFDLLPQTIQDAMRLVTVLGERYLWVDSLCIVQDPPFSRPWELNSKLMDAVYGNAYLTICAADGPDANAGLTGLSGARTVTQQFEDYAPGVRLMVAHLGETYIEDSVWNKRAWTFQERLLSRRCLIFTQGRIYFQCRSTTMSEDVISEDHEAGWSLDLLNAPLQRMRELESRPLFVYSTCVEMYTDRNLGRPDDIMAAFHGIGNTISTALGGHLTYCLPNTHFDWALLWEPRDAPERRLSRENTFPSWSWCGWDKAVMEYKTSTVAGCLTNLHEWLMEHTWIVWYIRDGHGVLRLVWDCVRKMEANEKMHRKWRGYPRKVPTEDADSHDRFGRLIPGKVKPYRRNEFTRTLPEYPYSVSINEPGSQNDQQFSDLRFLQFWTLSAHFRLERRSGPFNSISSNVGRNLDRVGISDCKGDWCGTIVLDHRWLNKQDELDPRKKHQFIALSDAKGFDEKEEYAGWTYYIPKEREQSEWDLYYVMLIETEGDISQRVGIGKVFKQAFYNSFAPGRRWDEFILE